MQIILNLLVLNDFIAFNLTVNSQVQWSSFFAGGRGGKLHVSLPQTLIREMSVTSRGRFSPCFLVIFLQYYFKLSSPAEILWGEEKRNNEYVVWGLRKGGGNSAYKSTKRDPLISWEAASFSTTSQPGKFSLFFKSLAYTLSSSVTLSMTPGVCS